MEKKEIKKKLSKHVTVFHTMKREKEKDQNFLRQYSEFTFSMGISRKHQRPYHLASQAM